MISFGRMSKNPVLRTVVKVYISVMRGTPLMLQLLVVYFGPVLSVRHEYRRQSTVFTAIIIGFAINYAAYFAEIYRSGIEAIPAGTV